MCQLNTKAVIREKEVIKVTKIVFKFGEIYILAES